MGARKRPHPYDGKVLKHSDFLDYKELARNIINTRTKNTEGDTVNWLNINWLNINCPLRTPSSTNTEFKVHSVHHQVQIQNPK